MPYLMHIPFDNSGRLDRNVYYFKYKDIKFKLIQNSQKYQDVLLTILSNPNQEESVHVPKEDLTRLGLGKRRLGEYLKEDCRNAIAHIERQPAGRKELEIDDLKDLERIHISTSIIEEFARFYIKNGLGLNKKLYLVRRNGRGFPVYVAEDELERNAYKIAYEKKISFSLEDYGTTKKE